MHLDSPYKSATKKSCVTHDVHTCTLYLQIEGNQHSGDDTSLNAVKLHCGFIDSGGFGGDVTSAIGPWGVWSIDLTCRKNAEGQIKFLTSFVMQVEPDQVMYSLSDIRF